MNFDSMDSRKPQTIGHDQRDIVPGALQRDALFVKNSYIRAIMN